MASLLDQVQTFGSKLSVSAKSAFDKFNTDLNSGVDSLKKALSGKAGTSAGLSVSTSFNSADFGRLPMRLTGRTPEEARLAQDTYQGVLEFPTKLKYQAVFTFKAYKKVDVGVAAADLPTVTIVLPMPGSLKDSFSAQYQQPALGPIVGSLGDAAGSTIREAQGSADEPAAAGGAKSLSGMAKGAGVIAGQKIISAVAGKNSEAVTAQAQAQMGVAPNPHLATIFQQMNLRTHQFDYQLAPASEAELEMVKKIVRTLRQRMLPGVAAGQDLAFTFPDVCDITFRPKENTPFKIKRCVLSDITFDYAPSGPAFFRSGDPVIVNLSMTFKEIKVFTRWDVDENNPENKVNDPLSTWEG